MWYDENVLFYFEEVLFNVTEDFSILFELILLWATLSLIFIVNQFRQKALTPTQLSMLLNQALIERSAIDQSPRDACKNLISIFF